VPAIWRTRRQPLTCIASVLLAIFAVMAVIAAAGRASAAQSAAGSSYVKYYVVAAAYQDKPENLAEIAGRFLGSTARSQEIFDLNAGVPQGDGGKLTDPAVLHAGWVLVLPWDAVGAGVHYGLPPKAAPVVPKPPPIHPAQAPLPIPPVKPAPAQPPPAPPPPAKAPPAKANPAKAHPAKPAQRPVGACAGTPSSTGNSQDQWAMLRVAPQHAWRYSRGAGVMVAIVDSGVDASVPELAGRVTVGDDIIAGTGRGNTDCLGSGTAMAGILAARSAAAGGAVGMAPDATVMPVRVAPTKAAVSAADQASAIEVAVSAGAKVIALGGYIDPALPAVASAIELAAARGAVVIAAAPSASRTPAASGGAATSPGVIWVGAININGAAAGNYQPGAVDVVAPGVDVTGLGITGTGQFQGSGAQYAVAFAAGEAALVRARYPNLTVAQVVRRIEATADRMGSAVPDATFGWGLIDPGVAVTRVIADEGRGPGPAIALPAPSHGWSSLRTRALMITIVLALVLVVLLALRIRRMVRPAAASNAGAIAAPMFLSTATSTGGPAGGDGFAATTSAPGAGLPVGAHSAAAHSAAAHSSGAHLAGAGPARTGSAGAGPAGAGQASPAGATSAWAGGMEVRRRSRGPDIPAPADPSQIGM